MPKTLAQQSPKFPLEFVTRTVMDSTTSITAKDPEGAFILLKMLSASSDVKDFRVFARDGILTPASVGQNDTAFPKWSK